MSRVIKRSCNPNILNNVLESKAGLLKNIPLLRDFKISQSLLEAEENQNEKIKKKLGFWWEA